MYVHTHALALMRRSEDNFVEVPLSFHDQMGLRLELCSPSRFSQQVPFASEPSHLPFPHTSHPTA